MVNPNYVKGRRKEYTVCDRYRHRGYDIVQRTAGSHSPIDIIAIDKKSRQIRLIQCKPDTLSKRKIQQILAEQEDLDGTYEVLFEVV